jgi:hypothetical protein
VCAHYTTPNFQDIKNGHASFASQTKLIVVVCGGLVGPVFLGIVMLSLRTQVEEAIRSSFVSLSMGILFVLPFLSIVWLFLWSVRSAVRSLPNKEGEKATSATTAACCCTVMLPLAVLLFVLTTDWWSSALSATTVLVTISILGLLCLGDVAAGTIAVNTTFNRIRTERIAKETTLSIVKEMETMDCKMNTDTARMVYEVLSPMSVSEMSKELSKQTEYRLINTVLEESGVIVIPEIEFLESIETHNIVL